MTFDCAAREADDCVETDIFDPAYRDPDGAAVCIHCATALGIHDPETDLPAHDPA